MKRVLRLGFVAAVLVTFNASAATLYVSLESTNPVAPYATWATAATNIQDAVDAALAGDTVLVTNGVFRMGSRDVSVIDTNQEPPLVSIGASRVVVTNSIRLESVNGPLLTTIEGNQILDENGYGTNGVRCVYLGNNGLLTGFTLKNGSGGGVFCEPSGLVTNCSITGNYGPGANGGTLYNSILSGNVCGAAGCTLYNCLLTNNVNWVAGGAWSCTLYNCTLVGNHSAMSGGGVGYSTLYSCTLTDNNSIEYGGGAVKSTLYNCILTGNSALGTGGGAYYCTLYNCILSNSYRVGAYGSTLYNCKLSGNSGGGAADCTLKNCTVTGNSVGGASGTLYNCIVTGNEGGSGGVIYNCTVVGNNGGVSGTVFNSIVYYNAGGNYDGGTILNFSCTTPLPTNGVGNITGPPLFIDMAAGDFRLREESPCIDAGTNLVGFSTTLTNGLGEPYVIAYTYDSTDILGNTRIIDGNGDGRVAWDIGAYEFNSFPPPRFTCPPQLMPDCWKLSITGAPNKWVRVQRSRNLKEWEDVWLGDKHSYDVFMGAGGVQQVTDLEGGTEQKAMFYRAFVP